ncbi:MAG: M48 family metallopeptidase, partial [Gammaproteobacteria bacterium]
FYLEMNPNPNAYTYGDTRIFITLTSGLVEYLEEDELQAVIAHECGHVACQHVLYHTMASMLIEYGSSIFGSLAVLSEPIRLALLYWFRRSELSADRAAAIVLKSPSPVIDTMVRLAGGPKSITEKVNIEAYIKQAETYDKLQDSKWDKVLQGVAIMNMNHPFPAVRAREIWQWGTSEHFQKLVKCMEEADSTLKGPGCGVGVQQAWKFCKKCGGPLTHEVA